MIPDGGAVAPASAAGPVGAVVPASRTARTARRRVRQAVSALALAASFALGGSACSSQARLSLGQPEHVADGVVLYRLRDAAALGIPGPISVHALRLDPAKVSLRSVLAKDRVMALETVPEIAQRTRAIAAINAGFFVVRNGDPAGVLEIADELVSEANLMRGAVGIIRKPGAPVRLVFDRLTAAVSMRFATDDESFVVPIDGVDTTRIRGKLMMYTPRYGPDSDTADSGTEWQLGGQPLQVTGRHAGVGRTPVPRDGMVLSYGGTVLPTALERLLEGQRVSFETNFQTGFGTLPERWADASDIVGGAGLLVHKGRPTIEWGEEHLRQGFPTERHPRTMIAASQNGTIWLVTVDGRNGDHSIGMTFADLQRLALGLNVYYALNLDGGGSTTMVVKDQVVNRPSDPTGPRRVSDALVVEGKEAGRR